MASSRHAAARPREARSPAASSPTTASSSSSSSSSRRGVAMYVRTRDGGASEAERHAFLDTLPVQSFDVVKVHHKWGFRQDRILRLTSRHIQNIKVSGGKEVVTKQFPYASVVRVALHSDLQLVLSYDCDHDFFYESPAALFVVQELLVRMRVRRRARKSSADFSIPFQKRVRSESAAELEAARAAALPLGQRSPLEKKASARKLEKLTGDTEEQRLLVAVDREIYNNATSESRVIDKFLTSLDVLQRDPEHMLGHVRQFLDGMRDYIIDTHDAAFRKLMVEFHADGRSRDKSLRAVIETCLERRVLVPAHARLMDAVRTSERVEGRERRLVAAVVAFEHEPQGFFGVKEKFQSRSYWKQASAELHRLNACETAAEMIACVMACARAVYNTFHKERELGLLSCSGDTMLAADDFLPILIYVVVHAELAAPLTCSEYMQLLCDPDCMKGEEGYYLTVFCSALFYLLSTYEEHIAAAGK